MKLLRKILRRTVGVALCLWGLIVVVGFASDCLGGSSSADSFEFSFFGIFIVAGLGLSPLACGLMLLFANFTKTETNDV